jgi:Cu/Zn superoxide dismutase
MSTITKSICSVALLLMTSALAQAPPYVEASLDPIGDHQATGSVRIDKEGNKLTMVADLRKLEPGSYSLIIHEKGACTDNSKDSGGVLKGGDLGTTAADAKGTGHIENPLKDLSLDQGRPNTVIGRAVVLSKNGEPVACGVFKPPQF